MAFKTLTSFEVLAAPLAPIPNVPLVQQGFFLQVSNTTNSNIAVDIEYFASPSFVKTSGSYNLEVDIIPETGIPPTPAQIAADITDFLSAPVGFKAKIIPARATWLFGVQYLLSAPPVPEPTSGVEARGFVRLDASLGANVLVLATVRQVFFNYSGAALSGISEAAYPVPIVGGPELSF